MGIVVYQAAHGYSEGHRQFACSADLTPNEARLVLVMSDASGSGVTADRISYLTGYPLQESGLYAIARTWPAPEMPRPGCVWTHTLFIEFADLAVLDSPSQLAALFKQPSLDTAQSFSTSLLLTATESNNCPLMSSQVSLFERLATALYEHPHDQVWARRLSDDSVDDVVLRLWDLQWPRLRRSFRFCTLTTRDRSQEGMLFDLQLCGESVSRLRFAQGTDGTEATSTSTQPWLTQLVDYANCLYGSKFREALRRLGTDLLGGRESVKSICSLQATLAQNEPSAVADAIALVTPPTPLSVSKVAREMVASVVLSRDIVGDAALRYVASNLDLINEHDLAAHGGKLVEHMLKAAPEQLVALVDDDRLPVRLAIRAAVKRIDADVVAQNLKAGANWVWPLLVIRPDLSEVPEFWRQTQAGASDFHKVGIKLNGDAQLTAAVLGLNDELSIESVAHIFGAASVLTSVQQLLAKEGDVSELRRWVKEACHQPGGVASFLAHTQALNQRLVSCIAAELPPDAVPNDYGVDPWLMALTAVKQQIGQLPLDLQVFGFKRALSWRSRSVGPLLCLTFELLHGAATDGVLASANWQQLRDVLPWVRPSDSWDVALRLRLGAVKRCIETLVAPEDYVALASTDGLFGMILDATWEHWDGKRYLNWVEKAIGDSADPQRRSRSRLIKEYIVRHSTWWK